MSALGIPKRTPLDQKNEIEKMLLKYKAKMKSQLNRKIKTLRTYKDEKYETNF